MQNVLNSTMNDVISQSFVMTLRCGTPLLQTPRDETLHEAVLAVSQAFVLTSVCLFFTFGGTLVPV